MSHDTPETPHPRLSEPVARRHMHTRSIVCEGFAREDGLWDIEARLVDTKTYPYTEPFRGARATGEAVHDMRVRLTLDADMVVRGIEVAMAEHPYQSCLGALPPFQGLIGARVGQGWRKAVQSVVGGNRACTHLRELLFPMATVAFQTMGGWKEDEAASRGGLPAADAQPPHFMDGCRAWASDGEVVRQLYPMHYKGVRR